MRRSHIGRVALGAVLAAVLGTRSGGAESPDLGKAVTESYPSNLIMITEVAEEAVDDLFLGFVAPSGATLLVEREGTHEGDWFLEDMILRRLSEAGYTPYLKPASTDSAGGGAAAVDSVRVEASEVASSLVFRFRIIEFGLLYPKSYRKSPLGSRNVQRHAMVKLSARLLEGTREGIRWIGQGAADRLDVVPSGKLGLLEGKSFPFQAPKLETRGLSAYVEPALVTGIVAGLIYLFYTNQD